MTLPFTLLIAAVLLFLSAAFSGLNIGLLMSRPEDLRRKAEKGDTVAARVYRYRKNGNYLIVCVLLGNVSVIAAMSLVLESIAGGIIAGLLTTGLITAFGEILPQSIFSRKGYKLTRYFFWLLDIMFVLLYPVAKPVSMLLDKFLGEELPSLYSHEELADMVEDHAKHYSSAIDHQESQIIGGALSFSHKKAIDIATPIDMVMTLELDDDIDDAMIAKMKNAGHSRWPVRDPHDGRFVGVLYVKDLLGRNLPARVSRVHRDKIHDIQANTPLDTVLSRLIQTKSHLFLVEDEHDRAVGIVTLEDVIEEILRREIEDEFDHE